MTIEKLKKKLSKSINPTQLVSNSEYKKFTKANESIGLDKEKKIRKSAK